MTPERKERCDKVRKDLFDQTIHSDGVGIIMEIPKASAILEAFAKAIERETWLKAAEAAKEFSFHLHVDVWRIATKKQMTELALSHFADYLKQQAEAAR